VVGRFFELFEKNHGLVRILEIFPNERTTNSNSLGKKKKKEKELTGSSWLFSKTSKNQQGFMKEPEVLGRFFGGIQVEGRSCVYENRGCLKTLRTGQEERFRG
jgi:hypothetical protein